MKIELVHDWKTIGKLWSVWFAGSGVIFSFVVAGLTLSATMTQFIGIFGFRLTLCLCGLGFFIGGLARIIKQNNIRPTDGDQ
jgi:hypothetical protein